MKGTGDRLYLFEADAPNQNGTGVDGRVLAGAVQGRVTELLDL